MMMMPPCEPPSSQEIELGSMGHDQQEIVWEMLMHAAHETSDVRDSSSLLAPYGADFGLRTGDFGVVAYAVAGSCSKATTTTTTTDISSSSSKTLQPVGAAWVRFLRKTEGFAQHVADDIPELAIAVLPDYQGKGIGSKLLAKLMRDLMVHSAVSAVSVRGVSLSCRTDNTAAMRLYEKLGFTKLHGSEVTNRVGGTSVSMVRMFPTHL